MPVTGDVVLVDQRERRLGAGIGGEHRGRTDGHGSEQAGAGEGEVVACGQHHQVDVVVHHLAGLRAGHRVVEVVVVRARDQLGQPRGAT